jgi:hypothetical protein
MLGSSTNNMAAWEKLYRYWVSKCSDGRPPSRPDIDPLVEIPELVANILLLDILPDGYRFRLVGSANTLRWGLEPTGRRVDEPFNVTVRDYLVPMYDLVAKDLRPRIIVARMTEGSHAKYLLIMMPLIDAEGKAEYLFGGSFYEGDFKEGKEIAELTVHEVAI